VTTTIETTIPQRIAAQSQRLHSLLQGQHRPHRSQRATYHNGDRREKQLSETNQAEPVKSVTSNGPDPRRAARFTSTTGPDHPTKETLDRHHQRTDDRLHKSSHSSTHAARHRSAVQQQQHNQSQHSVRYRQDQLTTGSRAYPRVCIVRCLTMF
jgi:hypothetical protein